jgi:MFS family permease
MVLIWPYLYTPIYALHPSSFSTPVSYTLAPSFEILPTPLLFPVSLYLDHSLRAPIFTHSSLFAPPSTLPDPPRLHSRRLAWNATLLLGGIFGIATGAAPNFVSFCVLISLIGFGVGGNLPVDGTMFLEFLPGTQQYLLTLLSVWWAVGQVVASLISVSLGVYLMRLRLDLYHFLTQGQADGGVIKGLCAGSLRMTFLGNNVTWRGLEKGYS